MGTECELPRIVEGFAEPADAAKHTDAKIVYEFMPYDVQVNDVDTALAVVQRMRRTAASLRHVAPRQAAARAGGARRIPCASSRGSSSTARTSTRRTASTRSSTAAGCPARASSPLPSTSPCSASSGTTAPGRRGAVGGARNLPIEQIFDRAYETTSAARSVTRKERRCLRTASRRNGWSGCSPRWCASASSRSA